MSFYRFKIHLKSSGDVHLQLRNCGQSRIKNVKEVEYSQYFYKDNDRTDIDNNSSAFYDDKTSCQSNVDISE